MKSVLMIAYGFPPEGSAGAHRPLRFVRNLPSLGWQPTVITIDTDLYERYDPDLLSMIPKKVDVIRVRNKDPWQRIQAKRALRARSRVAQVSDQKEVPGGLSNHSRLRRFVRSAVRKLESMIYHPDPAMGWIFPATKATLKSCADKNPRVLWATAGPVSSLVVAALASHKSRIPYVLDFRDAWTISYNEFDARQPQCLRYFTRQAMFLMLKKAQAVVFRYASEAECFWRVYRGALTARQIHIIPNGFEGVIESFEPANGNKCEILYTGTLIDYRYDTLLEALRYLKETSPVTAGRLHFHFVGEGSAAVQAMAISLGLTDTVSTSAPKSLNAVTALSRHANAFLVLGRPATLQGYELIAPAKIFSYLKAGRPIVGVLPHDETRKSLAQVGVTTVADADSISEIVAVLGRVADAWASNTLFSLRPNASACEVYSAEQQTKDLVRALEGVPSIKPFVPGSVEIPASLQSEIDTRTRKFEPPTSRYHDDTVTMLKL